MSVSPRVGGTGGTPYSFTCPSGAYISQFEGRSGSLIDRISARCSDGTQSAMYGGTGGAAWTDSSPSGFTSVTNMRGNLYAARLQFMTADGNVFPARGGTGGVLVPWTGCPPGEKIMGISGSAKTVVDSVNFTCGKIAEMAAAVITPPATPATAALPSANGQPAPIITPPIVAPIEQPAQSAQQPAQGASSAVYIFLFFLVIIAAIVTYFALRQPPQFPRT